MSEAQAWHAEEYAAYVYRDHAAWMEGEGMARLLKLEY
jgi:hypothetical protein